MEEHLARHIENLELGFKSTNRAEDRPKFESLLASAGCILSKVILKASKEDLFESIDAYEHLWGYTWIEGEWKQKNEGSYEKFKEEVGYSGYQNL